MHVALAHRLDADELVEASSTPVASPQMEPFRRSQGEAAAPHSRMVRSSVKHGFVQGYKASNVPLAGASLGPDGSVNEVRYVAGIPLHATFFGQDNHHCHGSMLLISSAVAVHLSVSYLLLTAMSCAQS